LRPMSENPIEPTTEQEGRRFSTAQIRLVGFIVVLAVVNIAYRLVYATGASHSAALYVGVPTLLAIGLALLPRHKSATGMILKGSTLAVLIACVVLPEGILCLLFVLPLIGVIGVIVGGTIDADRRHKRRQGPKLMMVGLPLMLLSFEGVIGSPFDAHDAVQSSIVVEANPSQVANALASTPRFDTLMPTFLTIGFNRPVSATGSGVAPGDGRTIEFTGGSHDDHPLRVFGLTRTRSVDHHADMHLTVVESTEGRLVFSIDHDDTMLARWVDLERAIVTWEPVDDHHTRVTWQLEYRRLLYPTLYFAPLQRFGMSEAADYLLDSIVVSQLR
jgi:hypothetical protein